MPIASASQIAAVDRAASAWDHQTGAGLVNWLEQNAFKPVP
ncbi:hypothetical protein [Pseudomonas sp. DNDY-54]|nr:hypothetical protein [Pseudomonas sp. DNDY-54]